MRRLAVLTLIPFATACTSTSSVPIAPIRAQASDTAILRAADGEEIRLDANSELRFQRRDGSWTPWRSAAELWVNDEGVLVPYIVALGELDRVAIDGVEAHQGPVTEWLRAFVSEHPTPDGTWSFRAKDGTWFEGFTGANVTRLAHDVIRVHDGLRWSDMTSAEVKNVSGGKTLVGVAAVTAVAVGVVALAVLSKGKMAELPFRPAAAVAEAGARVVVHASFHGCCASHDSKSVAPVVRHEDENETLWTPGYAPPTGGDAHRLFNGNARRRATLRVGAAFDYATSLARPSGWSASIAGMLRFMDLVDLGVGVRALGVGPASDRFFFARVGMHAELDARRRFALPFSFDLGGGGPVAFHGRLNFGLRVRVVDAWWIGVQPFNPTYTRYEHGARLAGMPYWSFPTMFETSFAF